jgi:hypothetical protein
MSESDALATFGKRRLTPPDQRSNGEILERLRNIPHHEEPTTTSSAIHPALSSHRQDIPAIPLPGTMHNLHLPNTDHDRIPHPRHATRIPSSAKRKSVERSRMVDEVRIGYFCAELIDDAVPAGMGRSVEAVC